MSKKLLAFASLFLAAAMGAACESNADIARKPALVDQVVATSLQKCDPQHSFSQATSYENRLRTVLNNTRSASMDQFLGNNITVCLDQRLSNLDIGFFQTTPESIYYGDTTRTLTLWDNGKDPNNHGFFETSAEGNGSALLDNLAYYFAKGYYKNDRMVGYSYQYNDSNDTLQTAYAYKHANSFSGELRRNPVINVPPLKGP